MQLRAGPKENEAINQLVHEILVLMEQVEISSRNKGSNTIGTNLETKAQSSFTCVLRKERRKTKYTLLKTIQTEW